MYINWLQEDLGLNPMLFLLLSPKQRIKTNSPLPLVNEVSLCNQQGALVGQRSWVYTVFPWRKGYFFYMQTEGGRAGLQDKTQTTALKKIGTAEHEGATCTGQFGPGMFLWDHESQSLHRPGFLRNNQPAHGLWG